MNIEPRCRLASAYGRDVVVTSRHEGRERVFFARRAALVDLVEAGPEVVRVGSAVAQWGRRAGGAAAVLVVLVTQEVRRSVRLVIPEPAGIVTDRSTQSTRQMEANTDSTESG